MEASRYMLRTPGSTTDYYLTVQDLSNNLSVSGSSIMVGASTHLSTLKVVGTASFDSSVDINSFSSSGAATMNSTFTVNGKAAFNDAVTATSSLNVVGTATLNKLMLNASDIPEYETNDAALAANLPVGQVYRTGGLLKITLALPAPEFQQFLASARDFARGDGGFSVTLNPNTYFVGSSSYKFTFACKMSEHERG